MEHILGIAAVALLVTALYELYVYHKKESTPPTSGEGKTPATTDLKEDRVR